jgi:hypothetical protein
MEQVTLERAEYEADPGAFYDVEADIRQRMRDMWE